MSFFHIGHLTPAIPMIKFFSFSLTAFFAFWLAVAVAQEADVSTGSTPTAAVSDERLVIETKDKEGPTNKGLKLNKEIRPRLPNGFGPIVDAAQKEKIYKIQGEYNELIAMLELRIELLKKERDAKIESVLTPSQLERVRASARRPRQ